jgi:ech hydrogenase subunit D
MIEPQPNETVTPASLPGRVQELRGQGWRFVQVGVTPMGGTMEVNYSFDREQKFLNLRLSVPATGARLPSLSGIYWCAFLYENEIHDLFGISFDGLLLDFKGHFYKTAVKFPFAPAPTPAAAAAPATAPTPQA